jgi:hypothetical protein
VNRGVDVVLVLVRRELESGSWRMEKGFVLFVAMSGEK